MSFGIITHTPEMAQRWRAIVRSDPHRVVNTLGLGPYNPSNRWGDTQGDIFPATEAVAHAARENGEEWQRLVNAGLVERLCRSVVDLVTTLQAPLGLPEHLRQQALDSVPAPYSGALAALCNSACEFSQPPTPTNMKVIKVLKKNWSEMMNHLWDEPVNTLKPGRTHIRERMAVPQTVIRILITDPSFSSILYSESDLTIPLMTRYWMHATEDLDTNLLTRVLSQVVKPVLPVHRPYVDAHPPPPNLLFKRILLGAQSSNKLLSKFASHLSRVNGIDAEIELGLIDNIRDCANQDKKATLEAGFLRAFRQSSSLWTNMFLLLRRATKSDKPDSQGQLIGNILFLPIMIHITKCLHDCHHDAPEEQEALISLWIRSGMFGALDEALPICAKIPHMTTQISRTFLGITIATETYPALIPLLRQELPRPRSLRALMEVVFTSDQPRMYLGPYRSDANGQLESSAFDQGAWNFFYNLQVTCRKAGECARRCCQKEATVSCPKCQSIEYCGPECQKKDSKEHKLVCGLKVSQTGDMVGDEEILRVFIPWRSQSADA